MKKAKENVVSIDDARYEYGEKTMLVANKHANNHMEMLANSNFHPEDIAQKLFNLTHCIVVAVDILVKHGIYDEYEKMVRYLEENRPTIRQRVLNRVRGIVEEKRIVN